MKELFALGFAFCIASVSCAQRPQEDPNSLSQGPITTTRKIEELHLSLLSAEPPSQEDRDALANGEPIPITKTIKELRQEYRDTLVSMIELLQRSYLQGSECIDELMRAQVLLVQAELMIAETAEDRLMAIKHYVVSAQQTEVYQHARVTVGTGRIDELAKAKAAARMAEIMYLEELQRQDAGGEGPATPAPQN